jgi:hypothetical protein
VTHAVRRSLDDAVAEPQFTAYPHDAGEEGLEESAPEDRIGGILQETGNDLDALEHAERTSLVQ